MWRLISTKLKNNAPSYLYKNYYGRNVWTVCATDLNWIEVEHVAKTDAMKELEKEISDLTESMVLAEDETQHNISIEIKTIKKTLLSMCKSRRFRLEPHTKRVAVNVKPHRSAYTQIEFRCQMTLLRVNLNGAITCHKLQVISKDAVIITS